MVTLETGTKPGTVFVRNCPRALSDKIKFCIPSSSRSFTGEYWVVQEAFLPQIKHWISSLNMPSTEAVTLSNKEDYYAILHLTKSAPDFVVDAVWRILARKYHPDAPDGNQEQFIEYKRAYDKIKGI